MVLGTRPPSLSLVPSGSSFLSALEVPRGDHTVKDSQQSVVHHERIPTQELESDRYPAARCTGPGMQRLSFTPECTFMAAGVLRVVFVYDLAPGVLLTISLSVLGTFGLLPKVRVFSSWRSCLGVVSLASDGGSLRWHHHPVFPRSFSLV